jgi:4-hydroxy-tetrahydrodipicolinate synthase
MDMEKKFSGLGVALVTPFDADGLVDIDALGRIVDHVIAGGVDYIVVLGTTAETPTLSVAERKMLADCVRAKTAGRVPLVIGMGGNDTARLTAELRELDPTGFDAVLSVTPYYNRPSQEGLYRHYRAVVEASPLPVILYNVPSRTGVNMTAETTLRIAREVPGVVGVKDACGNIDQIRAIAEGAPEGFLVISGDDAMTLPVMAAGGAGVISVIANAFPEQMSALVRAATTDTAAAQRVWARLEEPCRLAFAEGSPSGVKTALALKGLCRPDVRLPLVEGSDKLRAAMSGLVG